jgi:hypothetical protein
MPGGCVQVLHVVQVDGRRQIRHESSKGFVSPLGERTHGPEMERFLDTGLPVVVLLLSLPGGEEVFRCFAVTAALADHPINGLRADLVKVVGIGQDLGFDETGSAVARLSNGSRGFLDDPTRQDSTEMPFHPIRSHVATTIGGWAEEQFVTTDLSGLSLQNPSHIVVESRQTKGFHVKGIFGNFRQLSDMLDGSGDPGAMLPDGRVRR